MARTAFRSLAASLAAGIALVSAAPPAQADRLGINDPVGDVWSDSSDGFKPAGSIVNVDLKRTLLSHNST